MNKFSISKYKALHIAKEKFSLLYQASPYNKLKFCFGLPPFTGMVVLKMLGISVEKYYASEVDKDAINVSRRKHGGTIQHTRAIETLNKEKLSALGPIDLLLGGSPSDDLSPVNPARKSLYGKYIMFW
jgi:hypothetical protein